MSARQLLHRAVVSVRCWNAQAGRAAAHHHHHLGAVHGVIRRPSEGLLQQRHSYATRSSAADSYLVEVLKSEIEHELHEEANKQGSLKGSAGPFELSDKPGTEEVILRRTLGNEQIAVTCIVESQYPDADEEEEPNENQNENDENEDEPTTPSQDKPVEVLHLNVTITKEAPMPALELECTYVRGAAEVGIESVAFMNEDSSQKADEVKGPQPYEGPSFEELDENLQRAFHDLLKARGLSPKVATYVLDYLSVKEHREYMRWLHNVETFFST